MKINSRGIVSFGVFIGVFLLLMWLGPIGDSITRAVIWSVFAAMSVVAVVRTIRQRGAYGQDAAVPNRIGR